MCAWLPPRLNKEYLRKRAAEEHRALLRDNPGATYGDALQAVATRYGVRDWRMLMGLVDVLIRAREELRLALETRQLSKVREKLKRGWVGTLLVACEAPPQEIAILLQSGADSNTSDWNGDTLLHWVVRHQPLERLPEAVDVLLEAGADGGRVNRNGLTPAEELRIRLDGAKRSPV